MKKVMTSVEILEKIVPKGGIFGECAKLCLRDKEKAHQFVLECFEQCHNKLMVEYLGEDLKQAIVEYRVESIMVSHLVS